MSSTLKYENVWTDKAKYDDAERQYYERLAKTSLTPLADEVARARQRLIEAKNAYEDIPLQCPLPGAANIKAIESKLENFEKTLLNVLQKIEQLDVKVAKLEKLAAPSVANKTTETAINANKPASKADEDNDDGVDLFASDSDEESAEAAKVREERLAAYNAKKSKKPALIAKSNVILEVKPWDDETDMAKMEVEVRKIGTDGLLWGASKLVPLAYGIRKLQISCVVEDEKVSIDWLTEEIEKIEDYVQSADVLAFNKI